MTTPGQRSPLAVSGDFADPETLCADVLLEVVLEDLALRHWSGLRADTVFDLVPSPGFHVYVPSNRRSKDRWDSLDTSFVYVGAWGRDRDEAQEMQRQARALLAPWSRALGGGTWKTVQIFSVAEASGPTQLPPTPGAPERLVESGWTWKLPRHRGATVMAG